MLPLSRFSETDLIDLLEEAQLLVETANQGKPTPQHYKYIELKKAA